MGESLENACQTRKVFKFFYFFTFVFTIIIFNFRRFLNCPMCGNHFSSRSSCMKHFRNKHMKKSNNKCELCRQKICKSNLFMVHLTTHYNPHLKQCNYCMEQFRNLSTIRTHILKNHLIHACKFCSRRFIDESTLITHEEKHQNSKHSQRDDLDETQSNSSVSDKSDYEPTQTDDEVSPIEDEEPNIYADCEDKYGEIEILSYKVPSKAHKCNNIQKGFRDCKNPKSILFRFRFLQNMS